MTANRPIQCFVIEDDPDDQEIFAMALDHVDRNVDVVFANDGIEALKKLKETDFTPNFIFVDINMPRMNGRSCLLEMKKIERLKAVPVFIYSTYADPKLKAETQFLNAADYIVKPPSVSLLSDILRGIMK